MGREGEEGGEGRGGEGRGGMTVKCYIYSNGTTVFKQQSRHSRIT